MPPTLHLRGVGSTTDSDITMQTIACDERRMSSPVARQAPLGRAGWPSEFLLSQVIDLPDAIKAGRVQAPVDRLVERRWG